MNRVCIHQPDFAPYLGFFKRLLDSNTYVVFDDVQFLRRGWHHRDKIKTRSGSAWLTLPTKKADYHAKINEIELDENVDIWVPQHLNLLKENYRSSPYFERYYPMFTNIYEKYHRRLIDLNMEILELIFGELDINIDIVRSSKFKVAAEKNRKLIELVLAVNGDHYITGTGAEDYLDPEIFKKAGINLEIQQLYHPVYPQCFGEFVPNLSCIDAVMNCGPEIKDILRSC